METTQLTLGGLLVLEPVTAFTDFLITLVSFIGYYKFINKRKKGGLSITYFAYFFLFMGLGTLFAGLFTHAFSYIFGIDETEPIKSWIDNLLSNAHNLPNWLFNIVSVTFFEIATIRMLSKYIKDLNTTFIYIVIAVESLAAFGLILYFFKYYIAAAHIGFALYLISMPFQIINYKTNHSQYSKFIIIGSSLMIITLPVMLAKLEISKWMNFNDISHLTIMITMLLFMKAGLNFLQEKPKNKKSHHQNHIE